MTSRRTEYQMKGLALVAAGAAVLGLTACTHTAPDAAPTNSAAPHARAHVQPISCRQQYHSWTHGEGKGVMGALRGVSSAIADGNGKALTAALKHAGPAVATAAGHPIPACADPRGYWGVLLMHVNAAAGGESSASSQRAAMHDVPKIHHQLISEVKQTVQ
jgi:hypothetical protein